MKQGLEDDRTTWIWEIKGKNPPNSLFTNPESFYLSPEKKANCIANSSILCRRRAVSSNSLPLPPFVLNRTLLIRHLVASCDTSNHSLYIHLKISFHFQRNKQERTDPCSLQKRHYSRPTLKLENSLSSQYVEAWDRDPPLAMR